MDSQGCGCGAENLERPMWLEFVGQSTREERATQRETLGSAEGPLDQHTCVRKLCGWQKNCLKRSEEIIPAT